MAICSVLFKELFSLKFLKTDVGCQFLRIAQDHLKSCKRITVTHRVTMRIIIAIVDNNDNNNDNVVTPPDAISASIKRSSKIESLPRSLPH